MDVKEHLERTWKLNWHSNILCRCISSSCYKKNVVEQKLYSRAWKCRFRISQCLPVNNIFNIELPSPLITELARSQVKPTRRTTATARSGPIRFQHGTKQIRIHTQYLTCFKTRCYYIIRNKHETGPHNIICPSTQYIAC